MKHFSIAVVMLIVFSLATAQGDFEGQFLLTPRDSVSLSSSEIKLWSKYTCQATSGQFAWQGCKVVELSGNHVIEITQGKEKGRHFQPVSVLKGSFTAPNKNEVLVTYLKQAVGCCVTNEVLFQIQNGRPKPVKLLEQILSAGCLRLRVVSRRDILGCGWQYNTLYNELEVVAQLNSFKLFNEVETQSQLLLAVGYLPNCTKTPSPEPSGQLGYKKVEIRSWGKTDANKDGIADLKIIIGERVWKSKTDKEACKEDPELKVSTLTLIASDAGLLPTEATRLVLKRLNSTYKWR